MSISTKGRRKITVHRRDFVWFVGEDLDWPGGHLLHVISDDKKFIVNYHLGQREGERFLPVKGREFLGLPDAGGCWIYVLYPAWGNDSTITPDSVHRLINWSLNQEKTLVRVDYLGRPLAHVGAPGTASSAAK
ncbi:MAG: hypothetical protein EOP04_29310 [Proteobacteria bacterium]|nr:MAG: hypothetical protein EOP04_29310 [Pseudomonadota bacterium]